MKKTLNYLLVVSILIPLAFAGAEAQNLKLDKFVIGGGGVSNQAVQIGSSSTGLNTYIMNGTFAQTAIEMLQTTGLIDGKRYDLYQGFWTPDGKQGVSVIDSWLSEGALTNYPNPFNYSTTIQYELPSAAFVSLRIFDISGNEVVTLLNDRFIDQGSGTIEWDAKNSSGNDVSSGNYLYELSVKPATMAGSGAFNPYTLRNVMMLSK